MKQILSELKNFYIFAHLYKTSGRTLSLVGVWSSLIPINFEKLLTKLNNPHYIELENFELNSRF
jgi:hypothetical protein